MRRARHFLVVVAIAVASCGPRSDAVPILRTDHCPVGGCVDAGPTGPIGPVTIPDEPLEDWDTKDQGPLSGIFAVEATIDARVVVPVQLRQLLRLRIVQHGNRLHQKTTLCAFKLPVVENVATLEIPPPLQAVIQGKATEDEGDYLVPGAQLKYAPPPFLVVVGAKLAKPATDRLPTKDNPTGALDEDMDGAPGVTLISKVLTCPTPQRLFVALRTTGALSGTVATGDLITGTVDVSLQQSILGWSDECLAVASTIKIDIAPKSPFHAVRTTAADDLDQNGNVSCAELLLRAPTTFGPQWR